MNGVDQSLLAAVIESTADAIIVFNDLGMIQYSNLAALSMFGYTREELKDVDVSTLLRSTEQKAPLLITADVWEESNGTNSGGQSTYLGRRKDSSDFLAYVSLSKFDHLSQSMYSVLVQDATKFQVTHDDLATRVAEVEEKLRAQASALQASEEGLTRSKKLVTLGQMAGGIVHEIRNPLNIIRTSVFNLQRGQDLSAQKRQEHLDRIEKQVTTVAGVVAALTEVTRLPQPKNERCDIATAIKSACATIEYPDDIHISIDLPEALPLASIENQQISIVLQNLLRNACEAMAGGGSIEISAAQENRFVIVSVTDHGTGIPDDQLSKIMEPLFSTKSHGMGLGLAISAAIVERNRGRLLVESKLGVGTTFDIHLPVADSLSDKVD